ncbi:hypothetical protein RCS94_07560 [Orbaceae bacterium ac157xtp]
MNKQMVRINKIISFCEVSSIRIHFKDPTKMFKNYIKRFGHLISFVKIPFQLHNRFAILLGFQFYNSNYLVKKQVVKKSKITMIQRDNFTKFMFYYYVVLFSQYRINLKVLGNHEVKIIN